MRLALPGAALQRGDPRLGPPALARHPQPARPGRPRGIARPRRERPVRGLRPRRRLHGRPRPAVRVEPDPHRRRRRLGGRLPRPVGPGHGRPDGRRARACGTEVHAHGHGPPVVERPAELRGARRRPDTRRDARGPRGPGRGAAGRTGRGRRGGGGAVRDPARALAWRSGRSPRRPAWTPTASGGRRSCAEGEAKLASLRSRSAELRAAASGGRGYLARYDAGYRGDPRAHLSHAAHPEPPSQTKQRVFAETWAALSVGVLVLALAVILWFHILPVGPTVALLVIGYLAIESFAQRRVETLLLRVTVGPGDGLGGAARPCSTPGSWSCWGSARSACSS